MDWPLPIRLLLLPFSWIYGLVVLCKTALYTTGTISPKRLKGTVISVGNLTVGGTGKTPMVLWLAQRFLAEGKRVAILSRGYRGKAGSSDEVALLQQKLGDRVTFGVGADRFLAGNQLESQRPVDVFLLDDGYQHLSLNRDFNILLADSSRPLWKESLLPAGRLREPLSALARASALVFTRMELSKAAPAAIPQFPKLPIFSAATRLVSFRDVNAGKPVATAALLPQPVFAFCGIGNPSAFFHDLSRWGISVAATHSFRDHHSYSAQDVRKLEVLARVAGAKSFVTTEKDLCNLRSLNLNLPLYCCEIDMELADETQFWGLLHQTINMKTDVAS